MNKQISFVKKTVPIAAADLSSVVLEYLTIETTYVFRLIEPTLQQHIIVTLAL